jgi:hypothetical protein
VSLAAFREAVRAELQADLGVPMASGPLGGPQENVAQGCVWTVGKREVGGHVDDEEIELRVRVFQLFTDRVMPENTYDPTALEDTLEAVQTALKDKQTLLGPWFYRVVALEIDYDAQAVDATVVGYQANLSL